jgi:hypothetical protein
MQKWQIQLTKKCSELNMEAVASSTGLTIICPKITTETKSQLLALIPDDIKDSINFEEAPKPSTLNHFKNLVLSTGGVKSINATPDFNKKYIKVLITGDPDSENVDWSNMSDLFLKDGFFESWDISFNGNTVLTYNVKISKELQDNKFRDTVIQKDDILNLSILLGTETDFDKLLEQL